MCKNRQSFSFNFYAKRRFPRSHQSDLQVKKPFRIRERIRSVESTWVCNVKSVDRLCQAVSICSLVRQSLHSMRRDTELARLSQQRRVSSWAYLCITENDRSLGVLRRTDCAVLWSLRQRNVLNLKWGFLFLRAASSSFLSPWSPFLLVSYWPFYSFETCSVCSCTCCRCLWFKYDLPGKHIKSTYSQF